MEKIKAWIIDDEKDAHSLIQGLINEYCPEIDIVGNSLNIDDAWDKIRTEKPQLIYLDINLPRGSGLDLLARFPIRKFEVIVISAFSENENKLGPFRDVPFLQKPYSIDKFLDLTNKAVSRIRKDPHSVHRYDL